MDSSPTGSSGAGPTRAGFGSRRATRIVPAQVCTLATLITGLPAGFTYAGPAHKDYRHRCALRRCDGMIDADRSGRAGWLTSSPGAN